MSPLLVTSAQTESLPETATLRQDERSTNPFPDLSASRDAAFVTIRG